MKVEIAKDTIVQDPDFLATKCEKMTNERIGRELELMKTTFDWVSDPENKAFGLASTQVGSKWAWFVMKNPNHKKAWADKEAGGPVVIVINPKYKSNGSRRQCEESCFSIPGKLFKVYRTSSLVATFTQLNPKTGKTKRIETTYTGSSAQIFQHEFDHIRGLTLADRGE
jgi:peptide deformylase